SAAATGTMRVQIYEVAPDITSTISPGGAAAVVNISTPGQNGALTFFGTAGQRVSLRISDVTIPSTDVTILRNAALLPMTGGVPYSIQMDSFKGSGAATAKLRWSSPPTPKQIIPQRFLTPPGGPSGSGLKAEYYSNTSLSGTTGLIRTDPMINFDWGGVSPGAGIPGNNWSVRWTGQIQPQYSEQYAFCTASDDGARLWVNGNLLIDK